MKGNEEKLKWGRMMMDDIQCFKIYSTFFFLLFDEEWLVDYFWGSNMQEERQMVPVWPRSPVWEPKRGPGAHCGAAWGEGGSIFPISCTRHHLPLFDRRFPGSRSKLITSTVTWYGIPPVVRRYWHYILTDAKPRDVYPQECPPSRKIKMDGLTRTHPRP